MKKLALIVSAIMLLGTASSLKADMLPYFGGEPYNGSYWNGPQADYGYSTAYRSTTFLGSGAYAQASCRVIHARHVSSSGTVYYRTRRVCS